MSKDLVEFVAREMCEACLGHREIDHLYADWVDEAVAGIRAVGTWLEREIEGEPGRLLRLRLVLEVGVK